MNREQFIKEVELTPEEIDNLEEPCIKGLPCPYGIGERPFIDEEPDDCITCRELMIAKAQLDKIFKHPDVAWIDRDKEVPTAYGEGMSEMAKTGYMMAQAEMRNEGFVPVIPLSEMEAEK